MHTASLEDRVPMFLHRGRSMPEEYWNKAARRFLEDMGGASFKSPVPEDLLKMAEAFEVPETVGV